MTDNTPKNENNIAAFPDKKARKKMAADKKKTDKDSDKAAQEKAQMEEEYRRLYRAEKSRNDNAPTQQRSTYAPQPPAKNSFINWDKIPIFIRIAALTILLTHVFVTFGLDDMQRLWVMSMLGFVPAAYTQGGFEAISLLSPFTSLILHGGWMHVGFNLVMLLALGVFFERRYGARKTLVFFLLCGFAGHILYLGLSPFSMVPVVGASGGISGLFAVVLIAMHNEGKTPEQLSQHGVTPILLIWIGIIVVTGMLGNNIAWQSHLGGFLAGLLLQKYGKRLNLL